MTEAEAGAGGTARQLPLTWLFAPYVALVVVGYVADIIGPHLITTHPLLQIILNPRNRYLVLGSPHIDAVSFFVVGFFRLVLTDPIGFIIGWQHGDKAVRWAERRLGDDVGVMRTIERWFGKIAPIVIFIAPSFLWCILAGAARMRVRTFIALNISGTIARLVLIRMAGDAFRDELDSVLEWVQRYQWWLIAASAILVAFQVWRGGGRDLETPAEIAAELEEDS